jgi:lipoprotein-anchoring transpeptidase ErfK/SrfK
MRALAYRFPDRDPGHLVVVLISTQRLRLYRQGDLAAVFPVSTSRYGIGSEEGSRKTPLGVHRIAEKIGAGAPQGTVFRHRRNTGRVAPPEPTRGDEDLITSRILRLQGLEAGINTGRGIDTLVRHIYIHGTHAEAAVGEPASIGCVRLRNRDVIELFDRVAVDTLVLILP